MAFQILSYLNTKIFFLLYGAAYYSKLADFLIVFFAEYLAYLLIIIFAILLYKSSWPIRKKIEITTVSVISVILSRFVLTEVIRFFYIHPRPTVVYNVSALLEETSNSFPSGHASFFFALSFSVYLYNKKWGIWFFIATLAMTMARIMAGVHYPGDILGGLAIGAGSAYLIYKLVRLYVDKTLKI